MTSPKEIRQNAAVFEPGNQLTEAEHAALQEAILAFRDSFGVPCSSCRYCCPACPAGLDIPLLIQAYNEHTAGGELWKLSDLSQTKGPESCLQCGACVRRCPQRIDIPGVDVYKRQATNGFIFLRSLIVSS